MIARLVLASLKWYIEIRKKFCVRSEDEGLIVLLATPIHGNLGDQAIVYAEIRVLKECYPQKKIVEIPNNCYISHLKIVKHFTRQNDIIIIDGGGNLGTLWEKEDDKITSIIENFSDNKIVIFPQTCYYDNSDAAEKRITVNRASYAKAADLTVMLRDRASYQLFCHLFPKTRAAFVPDIVLSLHPVVFTPDRDGVFICFRNDHEQCIGYDANETVKQLLPEYKHMKFSTTVPYCVGEDNREKELYKKWDELSSAKLLICDRLHAMVFALITKTPCIALDNKSHKVKGTFEWIKDVPYILFADDISQIPELITTMNLVKTNSEYDYPMEKLMDAIRGEEKYNDRE